MLLAISDDLLQRGYDVSVIVWGTSDGDHYRRRLDARTRFIGALTSPADTRKIFHGVVSTDVFLCIGADVMDGSYSVARSALRLALVQLAADAGARSAVLGFSFNECRSDSLLRAFRQSSGVDFVLRDAESLRRFEEQTNQRGILSCDSAFLLARQTHWRQTVARPLPQARRLIGFNVTPNWIEKDHRVVDACAETIEQLTGGSGFGVVLIPTDFRGAASDVPGLRAIFERLSEKSKLNVAIHEDDSVAAVLNLAEHLDLVVSGRMHLAILGFVAGVPAVGLVREGKFEGLYDHAGLSRDLLLDVDAVVQHNLLLPTVEAALDKVDSLRETLEKRVKQLSELSAERVGDIVAGKSIGRGTPDHQSSVSPVAYRPRASLGSGKR